MMLAVFAWYLVRAGHLGEEGSSAAGEDVFHLKRLRLHRLGDMNLVALRWQEPNASQISAASLFLAHFCNNARGNQYKSS